MPDIKIREIDSTIASEIIYNDYVVLVPGYSANTGVSGGLVKGDTKLFEDEAKFISVIGAATEGLGFKIAKKLLGAGMQVQYVVIEAESDLTSAFDDTVFAQFVDKGLFDIRFVTTGGITAKAAAENAIKCAAERTDAVALVDIPLDAVSVADIENFTGSISGGTNSLDEKILKYGAAFGPWVLYEGETTALPASVDYLLCFATHTERYPDWFAMAGSVRGVAPQSISYVKSNLGDAAVSILQARAVSSAISADHKATNPICNIRPYGYIVWGNRTLYPLGKGLVASSFLNIRHIAIDIKKKLYRVGRQFTFEPNSEVLWINFQNAVKPLLEEMRTGQGISGYKFIREAATGRATLKAKLQIVPIEAVEDFDLTVELTDSISVTEGE